MDFVPVSYTREEKRRERRTMSGLIGSCAVAIAQFPVLVATGVLSFTTMDGLPMLLSAGGAMMGLMSIVPGALILSGERADEREKARSEQIRSSLNEYYGLNLSAEQFEALDYPNGDPGPGFQTYGSIKIQDQVDGGNFLERTLYLNSTDGNLVLSESRDGKRFKELKPARRAIGGSESPSPRAVESTVALLSISA